MCCQLRRPGQHPALLSTGHSDVSHGRKFLRIGERQAKIVNRAQMFIGEMACWFIVALMVFYRRLFPKSTPLLEGGYESLNGQRDSGMDSEDEEDQEIDDAAMGHSFSSLEAQNPAIKSLLPNATNGGRIELKGWRVILLALPACCDLTATTLMNVGLLFVAASIYQMTRGALVLFVGLFSVLFLKRKLYLYQWSALFIVVLGVALVGVAGAIDKNPQSQPDPSNAGTGETVVLYLRAVATKLKEEAQTSEALWTIIGVSMIALAQIFTATQFVLEEFILGKYELEPLKVVGWEGVFGFTITFLGMIILHFAVGRTPAGRNGYFDAVEGWHEISTNRAIAVSSVLIMISIGGFNFFGLSVTRSVSATARSTIDTCRTLFIWVVSLGLRWETFKWLQIVGFALLVYGTFLFNDIVKPPLKACLTRRKEEVRRGLLAEEPVAGS